MLLLFGKQHASALAALTADEGTHCSPTLGLASAAPETGPPRCTQTSRQVEEEQMEPQAARARTTRNTHPSRDLAALSPRVRAGLCMPPAHEVASRLMLPRICKEFTRKLPISAAERDADRRQPLPLLHLLAGIWRCVEAAARGVTDGAGACRPPCRQSCGPRAEQCRRGRACLQARRRPLLGSPHR